MPTTPNPHLLSLADSLRRRTVHLAANVPANSTTVLTWRTEADGTVERMRLKFYPGPELAVQVVPTVSDSNSVVRSLVAWSKEGKAYFDGNNEEIDVKLREPLWWHKLDTLVITIKNTAPVNAYDIAITFEVDYAGGPLPYTGTAMGGD